MAMKRLKNKKETMMRAKRKTLDKLDEFRIHPRQSYDEIINGLIDERCSAKKKE